MDQAPRLQLEPKLLTLASNHRWTWDYPTSSLLFELPGAKQDTHPVATVQDLSDADWDTIIADDEIVEAIEARYRELMAVLADKATPDVAYVSMEYGISELVPQYSGGLGILAGDHLKSASDLNLPFVAVGLFYRQGFFHQELDGNQQAERYETCDPNRLGYEDTGVTVTVKIDDVDVVAAVWKLAVGRIDLFCLDTNLEVNSVAMRNVTDRLYSGDEQHRVHQELMIGVGGLRALRALGIDPTVVHLNEGHAGFLLFEQLHTHLSAGADWDTAVARTKAGAVFTTHTPVPAGIDRFERPLVEPFLSDWAQEHSDVLKTNGLTIEDLYELGASPDDDGDPKPFNMAVLCLNLTGAANGVSKLHGKVSRELFGSVPAGAKIGSVTNGIHARTWVDPNLAELFDMILGDGWEAGSTEAWNRVSELEDDTIKIAKTAGRSRLIDTIEAAGIDTANLHPEALTVGFARRFATYKRADLLLSQPERFAALLADDSRPIQFVFAGKAHPADKPGKKLLAKVVEFSQSPEANGRFIFIPDYEMAVARAMYAGCDVWLNNPVRPREASGTSGEKAALNAGLQLSILDGWWDEMYDGQNGWAIANSDSEDPTLRDKEEAASIYQLLEEEVLPLFYSGLGRPTQDWLAKVRHNWTTLGPLVTATRMVADYRDQVYAPARTRAQTEAA